MMVGFRMLRQLSSSCIISEADVRGVYKNGVLSSVERSQSFFFYPSFFPLFVESF